MATQTALNYIILHKLINIIVEWEIEFNMIQAELDSIYEEMIENIQWDRLAELNGY